MDLATYWNEFVGFDIYPPISRMGMSLGFLLNGSGHDSPRIATAAIAFIGIWSSTRIARRLVSSDRADAAEFWTIIFGITGVLTVQFLFWTIDSGRWWWSVVAGILAGLNVLVKYNYGIVLVIACVSGLALEPLVRRLMRGAPES
ncbi:MAG: hypothetical protein HY286_12345 [Planctomycetes bacterium]|nr:hypothetical protein [Planctomycetota bacterium]